MRLFIALIFVVTLLSCSKDSSKVAQVSQQAKQENETSNETPSDTKPPRPPSESEEATSPPVEPEEPPLVAPVVPPPTDTGNGEAPSIPPVPAQKTPLKAEQLSTGFYHTCVVAQKRVWCWGMGELGQLGNGKFESSPQPLLVPDLKNIESLALGAYHTCALNSDGEVFCWGYNYSGQLGFGRARPDTGFPLPHTNGQGQPLFASATPTRVDGLPKLKSIASANTTVCGVDLNNRVWCWGDGRYGQLGDGKSGFSSARSAPALADRVDIAVTGLWGQQQGFCVTSPQDETFCFGASFSNFVSPSFFERQTQQKISSGDSHACGVTDSKALSCVGQGWYAQVASEWDAETWTPVGIDNVSKVNARQKTTCVLSQSGQLGCFGLCIHGQCGPSFEVTWPDTKIGQSPAHFTTAEVITIPGLLVSDFSLAATHICALDTKQQVWCWGQGVLGQLGQKNPVSSSTPLKVHIPKS